jgi:hypothetical protein
MGLKAVGEAVAGEAVVVVEEVVEVEVEAVAVAAGVEGGEEEWVLELEWE